jgi:uncharacterized SAM-binding protein YcdF (DUF218 family)
MRFVRRTILLLIVAAIAYPSWLGLRIWLQSHEDELHSADAIVVLGAAQYDGKPSPIFKARLDQGEYLFSEGFSDTMIVTGGRAEGDRFTEAEVAEAYLIERGIPAQRILGESEGTTTLESLRGVDAIAQAHGIHTILLVSDPFHSERIKRIAYDLGFEEAYSSPASYVQLNRSRQTKVKELLREIASLLVYEILKR